MSWAGILPITALLAGYLAVGNLLGRGDLRLGLLRTVLLWAGCAVLLTEVLSLFSAVHQFTLAAIWSVVTLVFSAAAALRIRQAGSRRNSRISIPWSAASVALSIPVLTAVVAWFSPPNTWDSLHYRMPRIAHWAQSASLRHFATGIEIQNNMSPGAEILMLQVYVTAGGDRWVNFIGWIAVLLTAIAVSKLAMQLGAGRRGQWIAGAFFLTLPMAIIQASSTMTDSIVALWVAICAVEGMELVKSESALALGAGFAGAAAGLAVLSKPTAFAYLPPLVLLVAISLFRRTNAQAFVRIALAAVTAVLALNVGHWTRNAETYGNPIGPRARISKHRTELLGGRAVLSNFVRNAALQLGTPSLHVNKGIALSIQALHSLMNLDVNDPRTTVTGVFKVQAPTTNEDKAGNPLHTYLLLVLSVWALARRSRLTGEVKAYLVAALGTIVLFSTLFKWQIFGGRYHLPFFALMAPVVGVALAEHMRPRLGWGLVLLLWLASIPWLVGIKSRPLWPGLGEVYTDSVLIEDRTHLYFANGPHLEAPYREIANEIRSKGCRSVGLRLSGGQAEYPLWVLLGAPDGQLQIEWLVSGTDSQRYRPEIFDSCAVVCQDCAESEAYGDLGLSYQRSGFQLFLAGSP